MIQNYKKKKLYKKVIPLETIITGAEDIKPVMIMMIIPIILKEIMQMILVMVIVMIMRVI